MSQEETNNIHSMNVFGNLIFFSCTPDEEILGLTLRQKFLSYPGYPTQIKIENSHMFDMHWLQRTSRTRSLNFTSMNVIMSFNATVMSSQYGGLYLLNRKFTFRNKRCARKIVYHGREGYIEKFVNGDHCLALLGKPTDARQ